MSLANAIRALIPGIDFERECILVDNGQGPRIAKWNRPEKQPTVAEIEAAQVLADAAEAAQQAKRIESDTARDDAKRALTALDTIIADAPTATIVQLRAAVEQMARIQKHHILATLGR
jgi:hypothetical protein